MNYPLENVGMERDFLVIDDAVKLLWEWRKYRNQVFWNSVYRWGAAAVMLTLIPYLLPHLIGKLGFAIFVFPVMACLLSAFASYLVMVQYMLYKQVDRKYRSLLGKYTPADIPNNKPINRIFRMSIGKVFGVAFLSFAVVIELLNSLVLFWLVRGALS